MPRVIVESTYDFDFYFTLHTLPFNSMKIFTKEQCLRISSDIAKQADKIIRMATGQSKGKLYSLVSKELPD